MLHTYVFPTDYLIIDTETTGLSPEYDELIEIGMLLIKNNTVIDYYHSYVKPIGEIPEFITSLTGITNEMVADAPSISDIICDILNFIGTNHIVGHNVNFDIWFIKASTNNFDDNRSYTDTLYLARKCKLPTIDNRLSTLKEYFNVNVKKSHNALDDCLSTFYVFNNLIKYVCTNEIDLTHKKKSHASFDFRTISPSDIIDEDSIFYNRYVCFTGTLDKMQRRDAAQLIVNCGGIMENNVTRKTNYLILGNNDYCKSIKDGLSNKHKLAIKYKTLGSDISIINENEFYKLIGEEDEYII